MFSQRQPSLHVCDSSKVCEPPDYLDYRDFAPTRQAETLKPCPVLGIVGGDEIGNRPKSKRLSSLSGRGWSHRKAGRAVTERHQPPAFSLWTEKMGDTEAARPVRLFPWLAVDRIFPMKADIKKDALAWLKEICSCLWHVVSELEDISVEYAVVAFEDNDIDPESEQAVKEYLNSIVDGARHDWGKAMESVDGAAAILFSARREILEATQLRDVGEFLVTAYGSLSDICHGWDELHEDSDFRDFQREWSRSDLEFAVLAMNTFAQDVTRHRHGLEGCVSRLTAYSDFHEGCSAQLDTETEQRRAESGAVGRTEGKATDDTKRGPKLLRCHKIAYDSCRWVNESQPNLVPDGRKRFSQAMYEHVIDNYSGYNDPDNPIGKPGYESWCRYIRLCEERGYKGGTEGEQQPRTAVSPTDVQDLRHLTSKFGNPD